MHLRQNIWKCPKTWHKTWLYLQIIMLLNRFPINHIKRFFDHTLSHCKRTEYFWGLERRGVWKGCKGKGVWGSIESLIIDTCKVASSALLALEGGSKLNISGPIVERGRRRFELRRVDPTITKALCQHHFKGKLQLLKRWEPIWKSKVLKKRALSGVWQPSQPTFFFAFCLSSTDVRLAKFCFVGNRKDY